ncbi:MULTISPECIES: ABC transporter ATP-binding protein [Peribacillus]|uniref:ABC transporter ATP-binding protein n=1 Tax=Peribacillus TaxID=2675229 RepID=UPI0010712EA9|nr:ABC transporter ATP-binding protein [Peribacillus frigoritolerans]MEC0298021.1 ABC transporter ATP-binding protein [Peribacillus castrilensis]MEC0344775.1 ABC transporter ATP-binding protein [Peribacillus castrilensis]TFH63630.1 ABC transporter ATP-binding protein [Peribacillus frigoritolerans]
MTVELYDVSKKYGSIAALDGVTLTFEVGKIYGVLGTNGSGKSTLLKLIAGLVKPDQGEVTVDGVPVSRRSASHVSYLTELDFFYPTFTAGQYIDFHASQFTDFNRDKAIEMLAFMKLDVRKKVRTMSKGNRGRLKLVLALSREAPVVLLDEPFSGLDVMVRDSIVRSLLSYIDFGRQMVIMATHEIEEIDKILDEVILIKDGEIISKENVEGLRESSGKSVIGWLKGHHS